MSNPPFKFKVGNVFDFMVVERLFQEPLVMALIILVHGIVVAGTMIIDLTTLTLFQNTN